MFYILCHRDAPEMVPASKPMTEGMTCLTDLPIKKTHYGPPRTCPVDGTVFEPTSRNHRFCSPACAEWGAETAELNRKERRKAASIEKSTGGGGRRVVAAKAVAIHEAVQPMLDEGVPISEAIARLPKELQWTGNMGAPHFKFTPERENVFLRNLASRECAGQIPKAAFKTDGTRSTAAAWQRRGEDKQGRNPEFNARYLAALKEGEAWLMESAVELAIEGEDVYGASQGTRIHLGKKKDAKLLAALLRMTNTRFAKANQGGAVAVNIQAGAQVNPEDPSNPSFSFHLNEARRLGLSDRKELERLVGIIFSNRMKETVTLDLAPYTEDVPAISHQPNSNIEDMEDEDD